MGGMSHANFLADVVVIVIREREDGGELRIPVGVNLIVGARW
jgi:hypothetical protein